MGSLQVALCIRSPSRSDRKPVPHRPRRRPPQEARPLLLFRGVHVTERRPMWPGFFIRLSCPLKYRFYLSPVHVSAIFGLQHALCPDAHRTSLLPQPGLRTHQPRRHDQPAVRGMDGGLRQRVANGRHPGSPDAPCPHSGGQRRELPTAGLKAAVEGPEGPGERN